jgi:hypothetical protein
MPFLSSMLLAAGVISLPANVQPVATAAPATVILSPNNCGTPDTVKPCHFAKTVKHTHKASAKSSTVK